MPNTRTIDVPPNEGFANNPHLPVIVIGGAVAHPSGDGVCRRFLANGWGGFWQWTVYDFHNYHPALHEALVCVAGQARFELGGPAGPEMTSERATR